MPKKNLEWKYSNIDNGGSIFYYCHSIGEIIAKLGKSCTTLTTILKYCNVEAILQKCYQNWKNVVAIFTIMLKYLNTAATLTTIL